MTEHGPGLHRMPTEKLRKSVRFSKLCFSLSLIGILVSITGVISGIPNNQETMLAASITVFVACFLCLIIFMPRLFNLREEYRAQLANLASLQPENPR